MKMDGNMPPCLTLQQFFFIMIEIIEKLKYPKYLRHCSTDTVFPRKRKKLPTTLRTFRNAIARDGHFFVDRSRYPGRSHWPYAQCFVHTSFQERGSVHLFQVHGFVVVAHRIQMHLQSILKIRCARRTFNALPYVRRFRPLHNAIRFTFFLLPPPAL